MMKLQRIDSHNSILFDALLVGLRFVLIITSVRKRVGISK